MFEFDISDELRSIIDTLSKRDRKRSIILGKKIEEIIRNSKTTIDHYQNCRYDLKGYKHVHIDKSFVLLFAVDKDKNYIYFHRLGHHDDFFKK